MSERDELALVIRDSYLTPKAGESAWDSQRAADRILAAGYRTPRTITTAEELDGLAVGSIVANLDTGHAARKSWQSQRPRKDGTPLSEWLVTGDDNEQGTYDIALPATALYEPTP